jgi:molybdopterin converting factor small subunit
MKRIREEVSNPALSSKLIQEVEHGKDLSNQEASKVYDLDYEAGAGIAKKLEISAHAQYRMDLRSITVEDVKQTLARFTKDLEALRVKRPQEHGNLTTKLMYGDEIAFVDPQTRLHLVFSMKGMTAKVITTYWLGKPDPVMPSKGCPI